MFGDTIATKLDVVLSTPAKPKAKKAAQPKKAVAKRAKTVTEPPAASAIIENISPAALAMQATAQQERRPRPTPLFEGPAQFLLSGIHEIVDGDNGEKRMLVRMSGRIVLVVVSTNGDLPQKASDKRIVEGRLTILRYADKDRWHTPILRLGKTGPKAELTIRKREGKPAAPRNGGSTLVLGSNEYRLECLEAKQEQQLAA